MDFNNTLIIAQELGLTPLNLILLAMLYFLGAQHGFFPKWWSDKGEKPASQASMDKLSNYYNHDTTEILRSIDANVVKVHEAVDKLDDAIKELKTHQLEIKEYGVKIRK